MAAAAARLGHPNAAKTIMDTILDDPDRPIVMVSKKKK